MARKSDIVTTVLDMLFIQNYLAVWEITTVE